MKGDEVLDYDEHEMAVELAALSEADRAIFAALCAERLMPIYRRFHEEAHQGSPEELQSALDTVWLFILGSASASDLSRSQRTAEALVPDEDDESWMEASAYGQSGAAAVAYAARTAAAGDLQDAVWAARQLVEAGDYAAQQQRLDLDIGSNNADAEVLSAPVVQGALSGLREDLNAVKRMSEPLEAIVASMRQRARDGGRRLEELL